MLTDEQREDIQRAIAVFETLCECRSYEKVKQTLRAILASAGQAELIDALNLLREIVDEGLSTSRMKRARAILASAGQAELIAWESTTAGYTRYVTDSRYQKFSPEVRKWYKPYRCSECAAPTPAAAQDGERAGNYRKHPNRCPASEQDFYSYSSTHQTEEAAVCPVCGKSIKLLKRGGTMRFPRIIPTHDRAASPVSGAALKELRAKISAVPRRQLYSAPGVYTNWLDQNSVLDLIDIEIERDERAGGES